MSLWIGRGTNQDCFFSTLEYRVSDDGLGEFEPSEFCKKYNVTSYDPVNFGGRYFPKPLRWTLLFRELPFRPDVITKCADLKPANCYVVLHDYEYAGDIKNVSLDGFEFTFINTFDY